MRAELTLGPRRFSCFPIVAETAKSNGLDPEACITAVLDRLARGHTSDRFDELRPWNIKLRARGDRPSRPAGSPSGRAPRHTADAGADDAAAAGHPAGAGPLPAAHTGLGGIPARRGGWLHDRPDHGGGWRACATVAARCEPAREEMMESGSRTGRLSRRSALLGVPIALAGAGAARAQAQTIQFVVPYAPGAPVEVVARSLAQAMAARGHGAFVVDNRVGANGAIGGRHVATARGPMPMWLYAVDSLITVNPTLQAPQPGYDAMRDLKAVGAVAQAVNVLVVPASSPLRTIADFIAHARREEVMYSSGGIGAAGHLVMEQFARLAGLRTSHVPYSSGPQAATDLIAGRVQASFVIAGASLGAVRGGQLRALAVSSATRLPAMPDVPTLAESGFPRFEVVGLMLVMLPASASPEALASAERAVAEARRAPEFQAVVEQQAMLPTEMGPAETTAWLAAEQRRWAQLIAEAGIRITQ